MKKNVKNIECDTESTPVENENKKTVLKTLISHEKARACECLSKKKLWKEKNFYDLNNTFFEVSLYLYLNLPSN